MAKPRHLAHAPVTEALVDIHIEAQGGFSFGGLQKAFSDLDFGYYLKGPIAHGTFGFKLTSDGQQPETSAEAAQIGLRLHSDDEKYVAQCRVNGFTLSRLPPYENWSALMLETKKIWSIYRQRTTPIRINRIAARFINNLQLPLRDGESYQKYLKKFADVPEEAPQALTSFFQRLQLTDIPSTASVNITLALESASPGEPVPVILDIDAFILKTLDPEDPELWKILDDLRALKNRCFFGTLTEHAAELYE